VSGPPAGALALQPTSLELRQLQTRRFDTTDEAELLSAAAGLLQDLGFNLEESESSLGFILATKSRDATDEGQIAGAVALALFGVYMPVDSSPLIRACIVTHPSATGTALRVTFQRTIWNSEGYIVRLEFISDPAIYQQFFERLSKAVFLEAHEI
jgi:hypothetical protein